MRDLFDVSGKVCLVTGGMGQLGRQYSLAFAERGARVVVLDQKIHQPDQERKFGALSKRMLFLETDVTERSSLETALASIRETWGEPEVLINNAALDSPPGAPAEENGPFETYPVSSWEKVMNVNLKGVFLCCQVFGGAMASAGKGSIINISSIYGIVSPDQNIYEYRRKEGKTFFKPVAYSASKSGILNLTRYLATYWGKQRVRVNSVVLAGVFNNQDPEFLEAYCPKVPLGRMADETDYNGTMLFLASDASSYMTGSTLVVDGGFTAW
ncbi:MAG: SDR family oxidoreductase [Verrucomicrobiota bacterium]|nr:SDR family oxidoreductase [Verrucomicrobiota bacterium]